MVIMKRALAFVMLTAIVAIGLSVVLGLVTTGWQGGLLLFSATLLGYYIYTQFEVSWTESLLACTISLLAGMAVAGWDLTLNMLVPFSIFLVFPKAIIGWRKRIFSKAGSEANV